MPAWLIVGTRQKKKTVLRIRLGSGPLGSRGGLAVDRAVGVRIHRNSAWTKKGRSWLTPVLTPALIIPPSFSKYQLIKEIGQNRLDAMGGIE